MIFQFIRTKWHPLWRLRKSPIYRAFQRKFDFVYFTQLKGTDTKVAVKFLRDFTWVVDSSILEPEINETFALVLDALKPKTFWDIGANIGYYSWLVQQNPSIQNVVLFEPDPVNFSLIQKTIEKNRFTNCEAINAAVSDQVGEITFVIDQASGATGSIESVASPNNEYTLHQHYGMGQTKIVVKAVTVDAFSQDRPQPDFIKIDVEGAEHFILDGAKNHIKSHHPTLIIETVNADLIAQLKDSGYSAFPIDANNWLFVSSDSSILDSIRAQMNFHI